MGINWFEQYTSGMRARIPSDDQAVLDEFDLKVDHILRVRDRCEDIARWLCFSEPDFKLASLCGLYHDLGRFEQAVHFGTMEDRVTGSHADMSENIFLREVPHEGLTDRETDILAQAIRYHNLYILPDGLDKDVLCFAKLIRDADKLDIFRHIIDQRIGREKRVFRMVQYEPSGNYNTELINEVLRGENLDASKVKTKEDRTLLELSLIFNLNYGISFQQTLNMGFVERLTGGDDALAEVAAYTRSYLRERVEMR